MAFYSYLSTKIIIAFITKSYQDLFGVRSYINALAFSYSFAFFPCMVWHKLKMTRIRSSSDKIKSMNLSMR